VKWDDGDTLPTPVRKYLTDKFIKDSPIDGEYIPETFFALETEKSLKFCKLVCLK